MIYGPLCTGLCCIPHFKQNSGPVAVTWAASTSRLFVLKLLGATENMASRTTFIIVVIVGIIAYIAIIGVIVWYLVDAVRSMARSMTRNWYTRIFYVHTSFYLIWIEGIRWFPLYYNLKNISEGSFDLTWSASFRKWHTSYIACHLYSTAVSECEATHST